MRLKLLCLWLVGIFFEVEPFGHNPAICDGFPAIWYVARPACPAQAPSEVMNQPPPSSSSGSFQWEMVISSAHQGKRGREFWIDLLCSHIAHPPPPSFPPSPHLTPSYHPATPRASVAPQPWDRLTSTPVLVRCGFTDVHPYWGRCPGGEAHQENPDGSCLFWAAAVYAKSVL